jgi:hypothetical protein
VLLAFAFEHEIQNNKTSKNPKILLKILSPFYLPVEGTGILTYKIFICKYKRIVKFKRRGWWRIRATSL